jgi:hypothetical protein
MTEYHKSPALPPPESKSSYMTGADGAIVWIENTLRNAGREHPSLVKVIVTDIFANDRLHEVEWKSAADIAAENPNRTADIRIELLASANRKSMKENEIYQASVSAAYAWIYKAFGQSSLEILTVDPLFLANDIGARCPLECLRRFTATHIIERDGIGEDTKVASANDLLTKFACLSQTQTEHLSEYHDRYKRCVKALNALGIDANVWLDTGKKHAIKFYQGMCDARYGQMKRDLANKIVSVPDSIPQLIVLVMQRKEAPIKADLAKKVAFITNDSAAGAQQPLAPPIIWYGQDDQNSTLSKEEYKRRCSANKLVIQAFSKIMASNGPGARHCGWSRVERPGRHSKETTVTTKPGDKKGSSHKDADSKVLMITNGSSGDSDVDTDEFDRVLFSQHKAGRQDLSFVTRHVHTEPLGIEPVRKVDKSRGDTTARYERELSQWTETTPTSPLGEQPATVIVHRKRLGRKCKKAMQNAVTEATKQEHAIARHVSDTEAVPSLCSMSSDSESDDDHGVDESHGDTTDACWSDNEGTSQLPTGPTECNEGASQLSTERRTPPATRAATSAKPSNTSGGKTPTFWVMADGSNVGKIYHNVKTLKLIETANGTTSAYRGYKSAMAAKQASLRFRLSTPTERSVYDAALHPYLDLRTTRVPENQLEVTQSIYRAVNDDGWVVPVGRGLKCAVDIEMGTEIAVFKGVHISEEALAELPVEQQGYVIDMTGRYSHEPYLVDCYSNTLGDRPACLASMANDPTGLYNRLQDTILGPEDANAAVAMVDRGGRHDAVLYAVRFIERGEEVLWNYHSRPSDDDESDSSDSAAPTATITADPAVTRGADTEAHQAPVTTTAEPAVIRGEDTYIANHAPATTAAVIGHAAANHAPVTTTAEPAVIRGEATHVANHAPVTTTAEPAVIRGEATHVANHAPAMTTSVIRDAEANHAPVTTTAEPAVTRGVDNHSATGVIRGANNAGSATHVFDENHVTLDSASTTHVCMSPRHATLRNRCNPGRIAGLGVAGEIIDYTDDCVLVNPHIGRAAFVPNAVANIISMSKARNQGVLVSYECGDDLFSLTTADGKSYVFGRAVSEDGVSSFYNMDITTGRPPTRTYIHIRTRFTDIENSDADLALSFLHSLEYYGHHLGPPSENRAMTTADSIVGCPIKPRDIERCFRIREQLTHGEAYSLVDWVPNVRSGQTLQVQIMVCERYTYLVAIAMPMEYSWCTELSRSVSVADAIDRILLACRAQGVSVESIETGGGNELLTMNVMHAVDSLHMKVIQLPARTPAVHVEKRTAAVKSTCHHLISYLDKPTLRHVTRHVPIEANSISNRRRSVATGQRPMEEFMQRPMVYTTDVGLQIGDPCVGTRPDGTEHVCVYLYPNPTTGSHTTYHIENDTIDAKLTVVPASEDTLWATVHDIMQGYTTYHRSTTEELHRVLVTTHTVSEPPSSPAIAKDDLTIARQQPTGWHPMGDSRNRTITNHERMIERMDYEMQQRRQMLLADMPSMCDRGSEWSIVLDNGPYSPYQSDLIARGKSKDYVDPQGIRWMAYHDRIVDDDSDDSAEPLQSEDLDDTRSPYEMRNDWCYPVKPKKYD